VIEDELIDEKMAEYENSAMSSHDDPVFMEPRDFENHEVHIRIHNRYRKSIEYRQLPDAQKKQLDAHVEMHQQFLQQMLMAQKKMMMDMRGAPGEKGQASQPQGDKNGGEEGNNPGNGGGGSEEGGGQEGGGDS
jgi:hypothetical protein